MVVAVVVAGAFKTVDDDVSKTKLYPDKSDPPASVELVQLIDTFVFVVIVPVAFVEVEIIG